MKRMGSLMSWNAVPVVCALAILGSASEAQEQPPMPLDQIERGLRAHPPQLGDQMARKPFIEALDAWALLPDTVYWTNDPKESNAEFLQYYLRCIKRALDDIAETEVTKGASIWKLYSSGFVIKTPSSVFAFDVVEGPFKNVMKSPDDEPGYLFRWTPEMRRRFAELVDTLLITHKHYDHMSYAIVEAMFAAGKTVVAPADVRDRQWVRTPLGEKLTVLEGGEDHQVGTLHVRTFDAGQAMQLNEAREYVEGPNDPQHSVYLVRDGDGVTFLQNGDNRGRTFIPWLEQALADGWRLDVWLKIIGWPRGIMDQVEQIASPIIIPGHEYEMGHKPKHGVQSLTPYLGGNAGARRMREGRLAVMTWGERVDVERLRP